jgi:hypothetical protein
MTEAGRTKRSSQSPMETSPPVVERKGRRGCRGCLLILGAFVALGVAGYFYIRTPPFSGSAVSTIGITMFAPDSTRDSKPMVQASITNAPVCASLFELLRSARLRMDHKCSDIGSFTIRYSNGKTDALEFLPGHDPTGYEFRFNGWLYRLPRDRLYRVLREAGVDTTMIPENEH